MTSAEPQVMTPNLTVNLTLYGITVLVYLYLNYKTPDSLPVKLLFLGLVLFVNICIMWQLMSQQCVSPKMGWVFGGPILTWVFLFIPVFWLLETMYVWLQPFGNTFGYLVIKLMGVSSFMDRILKDKTSGESRINKYINYVRSDPWGFFSMLTTNEDATPRILQASEAFDELKDKLKAGQNTPENRAEFINFVRIKESVAKLVFYLLTLNLMTDMTAVFLMEKSPCEVGAYDAEDEASPPIKKPDQNATVYRTTE
jgi:hypothetical protein